MRFREDVEYISSLVESKLIDMSTAKELASLPVMMVPHAANEGNEDFSKFWEEENKNAGTTLLDIFQWEDIPFYDFVAICNFLPDWKKRRSITLKGGAVGKQKDSMIYCRFSIDLENKRFKKSLSTDGCFWLEWEFAPNDGVLSDTLNDYSLKWIGNPVISDEIKSKIVLSGIKEVDMVIGTVMMWHRFQCRNDKYVISVKSNQKYKTHNTRTTHIAKVLGPRIIYLDKLPSEDIELISESGNGSKAPHQRKGHWATLKSERFKNHPKYLIKNGVYRKPAWIGDRTKIVHGATYTVLDKPLIVE